MRRGLAGVGIVFAIALPAGCGGSNRGSPGTTGAAATTVTESEATSTGQTGLAAQAYFAIDEIGVGAASYVTLTNFTDVPQDIDGLVLCNGSDCAELPAGEVAKGARIHVAAAAAEGVPGAVVTTALQNFAPASGEIAIYASGSARKPRDLVSYLEWGSTPHERTKEAIDAQLWRAGSFAPASENAVRLVRNADSGLWVFTTS